jgi:hypothetical protein
MEHQFWSQWGGCPGSMELTGDERAMLAELNQFTQYGASREEMLLRAALQAVKADAEAKRERELSAMMEVVKELTKAHLKPLKLGKVC